MLWLLLELLRSKRSNLAEECILLQQICMLPPTHCRCTKECIPLWGVRNHHPTNWGVTILKKWLGCRWLRRTRLLRGSPFFGICSLGVLSLGLDLAVNRLGGVVVKGEEFGVDVGEIGQHDWVALHQHPLMWVQQRSIPHSIILIQHGDDLAEGILVA